MIDLNQIKLWLNPRTPWEVDFRDSMIVSRAAFRSIKLTLTVVVICITFILSIGCGYNYIRYQGKVSALKDIEMYISNNKKVAENYRQTNKKFMEEKDRFLCVFSNFNTGISILDFLKDLIQNKTSQIKFSSIIIQNNKEYSANAEKEGSNFSIQLYGVLNDDVSYLDTYKENVLNYPSLKHVKNCKSFIQFDQNQNTFNSKEIKFQLTVQTNG